MTGPDLQIRRGVDAGLIGGVVGAVLAVLIAGIVVLLVILRLCVSRRYYHTAKMTADQ